MARARLAHRLARASARGGIGSSPSGPRRWYVKHDTTAASVAAVEAVEQALAQRLGERRDRLSVLRRASSSPGVGELPSRRRSPTPRARASTRSNWRARLSLRPRDAPLERARRRARCGRPATAAAQRRRRRSGRACSGCAATRGLELGDVAVASSAGTLRRRRSFSRRSASAAARWNAGLRGANGRGQLDGGDACGRARGSRRGPGARAFAAAVSASTRLPPRRRAPASAPRPGRPACGDDHDVAGPERVEAAGRRRPCAARAGRVELGEQRAGTPRCRRAGCSAALARRASCSRGALELRARAATTSRSAWYCANDRFEQVARLVGV